MSKLVSASLLVLLAFALVSCSTYSTSHEEREKILDMKFHSSTY